jgi:hypothetical protein
LFQGKKRGLRGVAGANKAIVFLALLLLCSAASASLLVSVSPKEPGLQALVLYPEEIGEYRVDIFNNSAAESGPVMLKVSTSEGLKIMDAGTEKTVFATELEPLGPEGKTSFLVALKPTELSTNRLFVYVDYGTGEYTNMSATYVGVRENPLVITSSISKASLDMGEEGSVSFSMKNTGTEPVRNITAKLLSFEGVESRAAPVFVAVLAPGEGYEAKEFAFSPDPETSGKKAIIMQVSFEDPLGKHVLEKNFSVEIQSKQAMIFLIAAIIILLVAVAIISKVREKKPVKPAAESAVKK